MTFFELACLERPFSGDSLPTLAYRILSDLSQNVMSEAMAGKDVHREQLLQSYSAELRAAVEGMLHKRPAQRASLSELLGRGFMASWLERRTLVPPPLIDVFDEKQAALREPFPDCYAWGRGTRLPRLREDLMGLLVLHVACGARHCAVVTTDGSLFTWGHNDSGQLGHGDTARLSRRRRVAALARDEVARVACGRSHTLARTAGGALYAWGSHEFGQLGLGEAPPGETRCADVLTSPRASFGPDVLDAMRCALMPVAVPPPSGAVAWGEAACGEAHSAALTSDGGVLTWGCPDDGRLGLAVSPDAEPDDAAPVCAPARVEGLPHAAIIEQVACGDHFTALLSVEGELFGFGANWSAQLGLDQSIEMRASPVRLLREYAVGGVTQLSCGADHMAAIDGAGQLWVWGGRFGETPARLELPGPAASGAEGGEERAAAAGEDGEGGAGGEGGGGCGGGGGGRGEGGGECGESEGGAESGRDLGSTGVDSVALVSCGAECVLAVSGLGKCFVWGNGEHGRLGLGDHDKEHEAPQRLAALSYPAMRVKAAACGCGVGSLDEGPAMLVLASPVSMDEFDAQFLRYYNA